MTSVLGSLWFRNCAIFSNWMGLHWPKQTQSTAWGSSWSHNYSRWQFWWRGPLDSNWKWVGDHIDSLNKETHSILSQPILPVSDSAAISGRGESGTGEPALAVDPPEMPTEPSDPAGDTPTGRMLMSPSPFFWILMDPCFSNSWIFFSSVDCRWMASSFSLTIFLSVWTCVFASLYISCEGTPRKKEFISFERQGQCQKRTWDFQ